MVAGPSLAREGTRSVRRVFLSYAREDEAAAAQIVQWLRDAGVNLYWWQDPTRAGGAFISDIEMAIAEADLFLVLMSPYFLTSPWCRHERDIALQREIDLAGQQFVYVLEVAPTPYPESGMLRRYGRLDASPPLDQTKLESIGVALHLSEAQQPTRPSGPTPVFRNREDELPMVVNALTPMTGGRDLWVVVAPPRMGKSWFLDRVQRNLKSNEPDWSVRLLDLREQPSDLRTNVVRLVGSLMEVDVAHLAEERLLSDDDLIQVAAEVSRRGRPQLYVLDSAELVDLNCAVQVRLALSEIYRLVRDGGRRRTKIGLLIGTRRHDEWRGLGPDASNGIRFTPLPLTEFREDVVHEALAALDEWNFGAALQWEHARRLHRLSEGLPALLVQCLHWATRTEFVAMDRCLTDDVFEEVARPYVRDDLLAADSLLPTGDSRPVEALEVLSQAFRALATYRLFTQSHLNFHLDAGRDFDAALRAAGWSSNDLLEALGRTSLCHHPVDELWHVIEPSIRRLLYRYYNPTDAERVAAHSAAREFYEGWTTSRTAGREQPVVLIECLWHEASRMMIEQPDEVPAQLPRSAASMAQSFAGSDLYQPGEFGAFVANRLRNDDELQLLLRRHRGLFDEIVKSVELAIGGEG